MRMPTTAQRIVAGAMVAGSITAAGYAMAAGSVRPSSAPHRNITAHYMQAARIAGAQATPGLAALECRFSQIHRTGTGMSATATTSCRRERKRRAEYLQEIPRLRRRPDPLPLELPKSQWVSGQRKPS